MESTVRTALAGAQYRYVDPAQVDILAAIQNFRDLHISTEHFEFPNGTRRNAVCLRGTIPVSFKGAVYNIPLGWFCFVCLYACLCLLLLYCCMQLRFDTSCVTYDCYD